MAMYDNNSKRQYTQYKRHINDSGERINAVTINKNQNDINSIQVDNSDIKDKAFEERIYTILENNLYCNSCSIDYFKNGEKINDNESRNIMIDSKKRQLTTKELGFPGTFVSKTIQSPHGTDIELNDFFLVVDHNIPVGSSIKYYIETFSGERWPISANENKLPLHLNRNITNGFTLIAEMTPNSFDETPIINGYGILYWDAQVEANYGLTNPDLMRFP